MTVKIDVSDGSLEFARGSVSRESSKTTFLKSQLGRAAEAIVENAPYVTYRIEPEPGIGATLLFKDERLERVAWAFAPPDEDASWSEDAELRIKELHDAWLIRSIGKPPYRYAWGRIVSEYDAKAVSSAIIVVYAR